MDKRNDWLLLPLSQLHGNTPDINAFHSMICIAPLFHPAALYESRLDIRLLAEAV